MRSPINLAAVSVFAGSWAAVAFIATTAMLASRNIFGAPCTSRSPRNAGSGLEAPLAAPVGAAAVIGISLGANVPVANADNLPELEHVFASSWVTGAGQ